MSGAHESLDLLPAFVCGLLEPPDQEGVASHLSGCPGCSRDRDDLDAALRLLGAEVEPPPEVWTALEEALAVEVLSEAVDLEQFDAEPGDVDPLEPLDESDDPLRRTFGPYEVLKDVSQSPRAVLYRARRDGTAPDLALKVHREGPLLPRRWVERFLHDAQALVKLEHPALATVREVGRHQGFPFFARDWVTGDSLAEWLCRVERPPTADVVRAVAEAAEGLHAAHAHGVLHRGLRPENIIVGPHGARVVDFALEPGGDLRLHVLDSEPLAGDPRYQAPEQVRGEGVDRRADVYGLGAVLFHLLSGVAPFEADSGDELLHRILTQPAPRLRARVPGVGADLDRVVTACLAKQPADRYASARRLAEDLRRCARGEPLAGPHRAPHPRGSWRWGAVITGLALAGGVAAWQVNERRVARADAAWRTYVRRLDSGLELAEKRLARGVERVGAHDPREAARELQGCLDQLDRVQQARAFGAHAAEGPAHMATRLERIDGLRGRACELLGRLAAESPRPDAAQRAIAWWRRALSARSSNARPADWGVAQRLAQALSASGQPDEALAVLSAIPNHPGEVAWERAQILVAAGAPAEQALTEAIRLHTGARPAAYLLRARLRFDAGRYQAALEDLDDHLAEAPASPELGRLERARVHLTLGLPERAELDLLHITQPLRSLPRFRRLQAALILSRRDASSARRHYERLREDSPARRPAAFADWAELALACDWELDDAAARGFYEAALRAEQPPQIPGLAPAPAEGLAWLELHGADPILCQLDAERALRALNQPAGPAWAAAHAPWWRTARLAACDAQLRRLDAELQQPERALVQAWLRTSLGQRGLDRAQGLDALCASLRLARTRALQRVEPAEASGPQPTPASGPWELRRATSRLVRGLVLSARLSLEYSSDQQLARAQTLLHEALALEPTAVAAHSALARLARRRGDEPRTRRRLDQVRLLLEAGEGELGALFQTGRRLASALRRGQLDAFLPALRAFLRVDTLAPGQPYAALEAAGVLAEAGRSGLALELLERAQTAAPELPDPSLQRGFLLLGVPRDPTPLTARPSGRADPLAAESAFREVLARSAQVTHHADARHGLALVALSWGDRDTALRELELAWRSLPTAVQRATPDALCRKRRLLRAYLALTDSPEAGRQLEHLEAEVAQRVQACAEQARQAGQRYDQENAIRELDAALWLAPAAAELWRARGEAQLGAGQPLGGLLDLGRAAQLDPRSLPALWLARWDHDARRRLGGRADESDHAWLEVAPTWLAARPSAAHAHLVVGFLHLERSVSPAHAAASVAALTRALELDPSFHAARVLRAKAYTALGLAVAAQDDLTIAEAASPGLSRALR